MNKQYLRALFLFLLPFTGCVVTSVHPYYTERDILEEPRLVGLWTNTQQAEQSWCFSLGALGEYHLVYVSLGKTNLATVHLFKLDGQRFLDLVSAEPPAETLPPAIPSHLLLRADQFDPSLRLAALNHDWLQALLKKKPGTIKHAFIGKEGEDSRVVLTADTSELQNFVRAALDTEEAWKDELNLERVIQAPALADPTGKRAD